jgi:hypothetical protein
MLPDLLALVTYVQRGNQLLFHELGVGDAFVHLVTRPVTIWAPHDYASLLYTGAGALTVILAAVGITER